MRSRRPPFIALALLPALLVPSAVHGSPVSPARAWVLDSGAKALICLALPHGERLAVLALKGEPEVLLQSPDGSRLIVLDRGPGKDKGDRGYEAKGKSTATVIDPARRAIVARVELGWGLDARAPYFSPDGHRLTFLCPGYEHKKAAKALARELVNIDPATGAETGRVTLEYGTVPIHSDGRTLTLIQGLPRGSAPPFEQGQLWIVDLAGPAVAATVDTGGWVELETDDAYVYLLLKGWPNRNPRLNRNGTLKVFSVERQALETRLDAGRNPRGLHRDEPGGQVFFLSDAPPGEQDGAADRLSVVRGPTLAAALEIAAKPRMVTRRGETVYAVGEEAVDLVDPVALQVTATIPLRSDQRALVDDDDVPTELELSADGKRAFILYGLHNKMAVLDLQAKAAVGSTKTGRTNKKVLAGLARGLQSATLYRRWLGAAGLAIDLADGYSHTARVTPHMLAVHPNGRFAWALNSQARDVTVVDAETAETVERVGAEGHELRLLTGGNVLAVLSRSKIHLLDTAEHMKLDELDVPDLRAFENTPDGTYAVALGEGTVLCLNGSNGKVLARLTDFVNPVALAFDSIADHSSPGDGGSTPLAHEAQQPRR